MQSTSPEHINSTDPQAARLTLLACQLAIPAMITARERDAHLKLSAAKISQALEQRTADLVVLPELSAIDYSRAAFNALDKLSEALDGPSFTTWQQLARRYHTTIVYGFPRRSARGFHITIAAVNPAGELIGWYDKLHLAQYGASMEKEYFLGGQQLLVFEVNGFRCAPIICYDIRIPELSRTLTLQHEVDLILHCGAYYRDESFHTWHPFATTRALENQIYLLSLNRAGEHYGHSVCCLPWMDEQHSPILFPAHAECFRHIVIHAATLKQARQQYTFLQDRLASYTLKQSGK